MPAEPRSGPRRNRRSLGSLCATPTDQQTQQPRPTIDCEWAPSTYPAGQADHWKILEASFTPEFLGKEWRKIGDIDAGLKGGTLIEAEYRAPYVAHQPLEPLNGIAIVSDAGMEIWVGHQSPQAVQYIAATAIGLS